jgi:hypothetical protein
MGMLQTITSFMMTPIQSILLTWHNEPGHRMVSLGLSSAQIEQLLMAGVLYFIAMVLYEGAKMKTEQDYTV